MGLTPQPPDAGCAYSDDRGRRPGREAEEWMRSQGIKNPRRMTD